MLQTIHDRLKGWVAGLVLGAIGLVFVFWGINWTLSAPNYAAKVNGSEISSSEVRTAYQQQLAQFERQSNGAPLDDAARNQIKRKVLDEYVNSEAVVTRADELGYRVSDSDLLKEMAKVPAFQVDGKFDQAHAVAVLKAQGRSVAEIEGLFRRDTKLRQLDSALTQSSFATNTELRQLRTLTRQQRELSWFTVSTAKYTAEATADEAAIKAYYDAHKAEYMTPETVNLRYVEISLAQLESKVKVDDAQLKTFYDEQSVKTPERFTAPEQRRVRHILFQADAKDDAATKAKAEAVLKRAQGGEDFAKLAKEFSQDTGSASQGGDLGMSERKAFVGPFADAAWSMKEGEIRGPVKTQFGYHIIKVDSIQAATVKTFEQAKSDLESEYKRSEAERLFNLAQDQLADAALQNTTDIDVVARKAGLTVHDIPNFSRTEGGGDLGKAAPVLEAAFSQDVLDGRLSPTVEIEKGRGVVLRATDHKLPEQKPLDAVRPAIVAAWKQQKGAELAAAAAADAVKRLNEGASWEVVAKSLGAAPQPAKFVSRTDQAVPLEIRRDAFTGPKPGPKPVYANLTLENGDGAVLQVSAVREDPSGDAKEQEAQLRRQYAQQAASSESQSYAMAARADAKVSLNPQALD